MSREDLQLGEESEEEKAAAKAAAEALQPLTDYMKKASSACGRAGVWA